MNHILADGDIEDLLLYASLGDLLTVYIIDIQKSHVALIAGR
jgi:hypothetical protein